MRKRWRKQRTQPESGSGPAVWAACLLSFVGPCSAISWAAVGVHWVLGAIVALPLIGFAIWWLYGRALLLASFVWRERGVLVYSESPKWHAYIRDEWLPRLDPILRVLNWSQRSQWRSTRETELWRYFFGTEEFNPAVLILRGVRHPLVYRFYVPFVAATKVGDVEPLKKLERHLFDTLGIEPPSPDVLPEVVRRDTETSSPDRE